MAEREGFEPSVGISHARFPGVCLKPLSHLSAAAFNVTFARERGNLFCARHPQDCPVAGICLTSPVFHTSVTVRIYVTPFVSL